MGERGISFGSWMSSNPVAGCLVKGSKVVNW